MKTYSAKPSEIEKKAIELANFLNVPFFYAISENKDITFSSENALLYITPNFM